MKNRHSHHYFSFGWQTIYCMFNLMHQDDGFLVRSNYRHNTRNKLII